MCVAAGGGVCMQKEKQDLGLTAFVFLCKKASASVHVSNGKWGLGLEELEVGLDPGEL